MSRILPPCQVIFAAKLRSLDGQIPEEGEEVCATQTPRTERREGRRPLSLGELSGEGESGGGKGAVRGSSASGERGGEDGE